MTIEYKCDQFGNRIGLADLPKKEDATNPNYYQSERMQVWDIMTEFNLGYFEGNIIKYVVRYKNKNKVEDLKKARVYLDKLISMTEDT